MELHHRHSTHRRSVNKTCSVRDVCPSCEPRTSTLSIAWTTPQYPRNRFLAHLQARLMRRKTSSARSGFCSKSRSCRSMLSALCTKDVISCPTACKMQRDVSQCLTVPAELEFQNNNCMTQELCLARACVQVKVCEASRKELDSPKRAPKATCGPSAVNKPAAQAVGRLTCT